MATTNTADEPPSSTTVPEPVTTTATDYPSLQPALHLRVGTWSPTVVGSLSRGTPLTVVPLVGGTLVSEPGYPVRVDASMRGNGADYVHTDPDGGRMRLRTDLVMADDNGETIHVHYTGIVDINADMRRILGRSENARSTEYGHAFIHVTFETGSMRYKALEQGVFVGAGRFVLEEGDLKVEYRISQVCKGSGLAEEGSA
ncbi:hypothetical protein EDD37DRAFT_645224 [Exophiala viscosa]|uniref:Uncharacterized protein n=1 Tax=Exophiala viscosa TaxID=2486360 RepID=A0AAN6E2H7_9EURO|nr:hypothetical protein EDD36DRAFT_461836 [Exophiala viscosa]KAI1629467.1 hypothetical protein EDD37DRAFT_645224 [Exophiala viscosa]